MERIVERNKNVMYSSDTEECSKILKLLGENLGVHNAINRIINLLKIFKKYQSYAFVQDTLQPWDPIQRTDLFYTQTPEKMSTLGCLDWCDIWNNTALLYHLKEQRPECAHALMKAGANIMLLDKEGNPLVLEYCLKFGYNNLLKNVFTNQMVKYLDDRDIPYPALEIAARHNNNGAIRFILDYR